MGVCYEFANKPFINVNELCRSNSFVFDGDFSIFLEKYDEMQREGFFLKTAAKNSSIN